MYRETKVRTSDDGRRSGIAPAGPRNLDTGTTEARRAGTSSARGTIHLDVPPVLPAATNVAEKDDDDDDEKNKGNDKNDEKRERQRLFVVTKKAKTIHEKEIIIIIVLVLVVVVTILIGTTAGGAVYDGIRASTI